MPVSTTMIVLGCVCIVLGWYARQAWDEMVDWMQEAGGVAAGALWDLAAVLGFVAVVAAIAWFAYHH
jgi:hypothetical protein